MLAHLAKLFAIMGVSLTEQDMFAMDGGDPGSIQIFAKQTSIGNVINFAASVIPGVMLVGKTFDVDFHYDSHGFEINAEAITVDTFSCLKSGLQWKPDSEDNRLQIFFSEINANGQYQGNMTDKALHMSATPLYWNITNATIVVDFATTSDDKVHWKLDENANITFDNVDIHFKESFFNFLLKSEHKAFMELISFGMWEVETLLNGYVQKLNAMVAAEDANPDTFLATLEGFPLNFTMARFPEFNQAGNSITANIDGRAFSTAFNKTMEPKNTEWAALQTDVKQIEQIFVHQSTLSSMLYDFKPTISAATFVADHPEVKSHYGNDVDCEFEFVFTGVNGEAYDEPVQILKDTGIVIGGSKAAEGFLDTTPGIPVTVNLNCGANVNATKELSHQLTSNVGVTFNGTFDNFAYYAMFKDQVVAGTQAVTSAYPIATADWQADLSKAVDAGVADFNTKHETVVDLKKNMTIGFVAGIMKATLLTPFQLDHFLYAGFRWISDM